MKPFMAAVAVEHCGGERLWQAADAVHLDGYCAGLGPSDFCASLPFRKWAKFVFFNALRQMSSHSFRSEKNRVDIASGGNFYKESDCEHSTVTSVLLLLNG